MSEISSANIINKIRSRLEGADYAKHWSKIRKGNVSMEPYHLETTDLLRQQLGEHIGTTVKAAVWVPPIESSDFGSARCAFNLMNGPGDGADKAKRDAVAKSMKDFMQARACPSNVVINNRHNSTICALQLASGATEEAFVDGVVDVLEYLDEFLPAWCAEILPALQLPENETMTVSNHESEKLFTWVPIQMEAVQKLLELKDDRGELIAALESLHAAGLTTIPLSDKPTEDTEGKISDTDPFTFLANFNRGTKDSNRVAMWKALKERWGLASPVPSDFAGLPLVNLQNSWFGPWAYQLQDGDVDALWDIAAAAVEAPSKVSDAMLQRALAVKNVALAKLTMGLFWLKPEVYVALDKKNASNLKKMGLNPQIKTWPEYLQLLDDFKQMSRQSICEFSHQAHLDATGGGGGVDVSGTLVKESPNSYGPIHPLMDSFKRVMYDFESFENPGDKFRENELDYKRKLLAEFQELRPQIEANLESGQGVEAVTTLKGIINKSNLVDWRGLENAFGKPIQEVESLQLLNAVRRVAQGSYQGPETLVPIFEILDKQGRKVGWTLLTVLLWLWNPDEYYPIKSSFIRQFARRLGRKLKKASPSPEHFDEFMQLASDTRKMLEPWRPTDW
ncbi:MAG TPA: hypothetical protein DEA90_15065, partial [Opitutae bacterium]|nr:hypothetical protein [Opitutae bacterium]